MGSQKNEQNETPSYSDPFLQSTDTPEEPLNKDPEVQDTASHANKSTLEVEHAEDTAPEIVTEDQKSNSIELYYDPFQDKEILSTDTSVLEVENVEIKDSRKSHFRTQSHSLLSALNSDLVWWSAACACVVAVFLFYFQALQPLILRNYIQLVQNNQTAVVAEFAGYTQTINELETNLVSRFEYNPTESCTNVETYSSSQLQSDLALIELSVSKIVPDSSLETKPTIYGFYESKIDGIYTDFYETYLENVSATRDIAKSFSAYTAWFVYQNAWVEACQSVETSRFTQVIRNDVCEDLNNAATIFTEKVQDTSNTINLQQISEYTTFCTDALNNPTEWNIGFLNGYDSVLRETVFEDGIGANISKIGADLDFKRLQDSEEILDIFNQKKEFTNLWYILNR